MEPVYPHNPDLERAILGALLTYPERLSEVRERLTADDFFLAPHAELYAEFLEGRTSPFTARVDEMSSADIAAMQDGIPRSFALSDACDSLIDLSDRRAVSQTLQAALIGIEDAATAQDVAESVIGNIRQSVRLARAGGRPLKDAITELMDSLDQPVGVLPTGLPLLDRLGAGYRPGELTVLAGRPSCGKSAFAIQSAKAVAEAGHPVWFASLEMTAAALSMRWISNTGQVDFGHLHRNDLNATEYQRISESVESLSALPIQIDDRSGLGLGDLRRAMVQQEGGLLVVDYLQLLNPPSFARAYRSRTAEVGALSRGLKSIAHDCHVSVLALCQLNRAVEARGGMPYLSDLRDSGEIEQDADLVWMLAKLEDSDVPDRTVLSIRKFRNGPLGDIDVVFHGGTQRFRERNDHDQQPSKEGSMREKVRTW